MKNTHLSHILGCAGSVTVLLLVAFSVNTSATDTFRYRAFLTDGESEQIERVFVDRGLTKRYRRIQQRIDSIRHWRLRGSAPKEAQSEVVQREIPKFSKRSIRVQRALDRTARKTLEPTEEQIAEKSGAFRRTIERPKLLTLEQRRKKRIQEHLHAAAPRKYVQQDFEPEEKKAPLPIGYLAKNKWLQSLPAAYGATQKMASDALECIQQTIVTRERNIDELRQYASWENPGMGLFNQGQFYFQNGGENYMIYATFRAAGELGEECGTTVANYLEKQFSSRDIERAQRPIASFIEMLSGQTQGVVLQKDMEAQKEMEQRNNERRSKVWVFVDVTTKYYIDNGVFPANLPIGIEGEVCATNAENCDGLINMNAYTKNVLTYPALPVDPLLTEDSDTTGYHMSIAEGTGEKPVVTVKAVHAEGGEVIEAVY